MSVQPDFSRRRFLRTLGFGALGLAPSAPLHGRNQGVAHTGFGKAKRCLMLFLWGGPSHIDTFDMKPDAPAEYRGEFKPIQTSVPGIRWCEHLPRLSRLAHHLAVVRSLTMQGRGNADHHVDAYYLMTGQVPTAADRAQGINRKPRSDDWPFIGSAVSYCRRHDPSLPAVVALPRVRNEFDGYIVPGQFAARLGPAHEPLWVRGTPDSKLPQSYKSREFRVPSLQPPDEVKSGRLLDRRNLVGVLDRWQRGVEGRGGPADTFDTHQQRAYALLTSSKFKKALELEREPEALRARYGDNVTAQSTLLARRLLEAGVPFVCVHWTTPEYSPLVANWDTHGDNFPHLKRDLLPVFDSLLSSLLVDLEQRGLLEETLVVAVGEMGRTPKCADPRTNGTKYGPGRDHWVGCQFAVLAGGGIRGGQLYGSSDRIAAYPKENAVWPGDLAATVYHSLGIRRDQLVHTDRQGRPVNLLDEGEAIPLFS